MLITVLAGDRFLICPLKSANWTNGSYILSSWKAEQSKLLVLGYIAVWFIFVQGNNLFQAGLCFNK